MVVQFRDNAGLSKIGFRVLVSSDESAMWDFDSNISLEHFVLSEIDAAKAPAAQKSDYWVSTNALRDRAWLGTRTCCSFWLSRRCLLKRVHGQFASIKLDRISETSISEAKSS